MLKLLLVSAFFISMTLYSQEITYGASVGANFFELSVEKFGDWQHRIYRSF